MTIEGATLNIEKSSLTAELSDGIAKIVSEWKSSEQIKRLWSRDPSIWTGSEEDKYLGWLDIPSEQLSDLFALQALQLEVTKNNFSDVVLLGMGGASLSSEVLRFSFGDVPGFPDFKVLDSTDPEQVASIEERINLKRTLFIVSSKSGTTIEPNILYRYFNKKVQEQLESKRTGKQFVAITDPGSVLESLAVKAGFKHVYHGIPSIGGRFSALSNFGMVPAAVMGLDIERLLRGAQTMQNACRENISIEDNPGAMLGLTLGVASKTGREKITFVISPGVRGLGGWLEQLLAESIGKKGIGLMPVDGETIADPSVYGNDRLFVYIRDSSTSNQKQDQSVLDLEKSGQPVLRLVLRNNYDLGMEFFRWEFAAAVAGSVLQINPFDQPDVELSKLQTKRLTDTYEKNGAFSIEKPLALDDSIEVYADDFNSKCLQSISSGTSVEQLVRAQLRRLKPGDYLGVLAYINMSADNQAKLLRLRHVVRDRFGVATCVGFGPRFLHSTGQLHKAGKNLGVFFQITCEDAADLSVPGSNYSFSVVKEAQARGDFDILASRKRRILRLHIKGNVSKGLNRIIKFIESQK